MGPENDREPGPGCPGAGLISVYTARLLISSLAAVYSMPEDQGPPMRSCNTHLPGSKGKQIPDAAVPSYKYLCKGWVSRQAQVSVATFIQCYGKNTVISQV